MPDFASHEPFSVASNDKECTHALIVVIFEDSEACSRISWEYVHQTIVLFPGDYSPR
jgi:hypothetical protein